MSAMSDSELDAKHRQALGRLERYQQRVATRKQTATKPDITGDLFHALLKHGIVATPTNPNATSAAEAAPSGAPPKNANVHIISWIISPRLPAEWEPLSPAFRETLRPLLSDVQCEPGAEECDDDTLQKRGRWWTANLIRGCTFPFVNMI
jgi:hypothetical protein